MARRIIAVLIVVALGFTGFMAFKYFNAKKEVQTVVRNYNNNLIQAMRRPEPDLVKRWTTSKELERVTMYILYLYGKNQILDARLISLKFTDVQVKGNTAKAVTDELWEDHYLDAKTRQEVGQKENYHYQGTYNLEKDKNGNWLVSELQVKEL